MRDDVRAGDGIPEAAPVASATDRGGAVVRVLTGAVMAVLALSLWNALVVFIGDESYRSSPGRLFDLLRACLGGYLLLAAPPIILLSTILMAVIKRRGGGTRGNRRGGRAASIPAAVASATCFFLLLPGGLGGFRSGVAVVIDSPLLTDLLLAVAGAVAVGLLGLHLHDRAHRAPAHAARIRRLAILAGAAPLSLAAWGAIRDLLGAGGSLVVKGISALTSLAAGLAAAWAVGALVALAGAAGRRIAGMMGRPRRIPPVAALLALLVAAAAVAAVLRQPSAAGAAAASPAGRNVLVLVADTLRADRVGCYGSTRARTPNIDALAAEGTRVGGVSAVSAWTAPNTASILTGLYPDRHGLRSYTDRIGPGAVSFAEIFSQAGYATAGFSANPILSPRIGFGAGFDLWEENFVEAGLRSHPRAPFVQSLRLLGLLPPRERFARADELVDRALEWIDRPRAGPFLLYLQFMDTHDPYAPPPPFDTLYGEGEGGDFRMTFGTLADILAARLPAGRAELDRMMELYDGSVTWLDDRIGFLMAEVDRRGLLDDTLVVFTFDHGEEFLDHGDLEHTRTLYEEIVQGPLIFRGPGVRAGQLLPATVPQVDIAPTLLEGAGMRAGSLLDGRSLWPGISGTAPFEPREAFGSLRYFGFRSPWHELTSLRSGDLKLLGSRGTLSGSTDWGWSLFDLAGDPGESRDLKDVRSAEFEALRDRLEGWLAGRTEIEVAPEEEDPEIQKRLRTLGYVD